MDRELEIVFHNMAPSAALESDIRKRAGKLERLFPHIIGCRVAVEVPHKQHHRGNVPEVHVEIDVPQQKLVVSRAPHHARERHSSPDARTSIRDAFDAAEIQLKDYKRKLTGEVKPQPVPLTGRVQQLFGNEDYGFLTTAGGTQLYFHRNSLMNGDFDALNVGDSVHYIEGDGDTGPTAAKLWRA